MSGVNLSVLINVVQLKKYISGFATAIAQVLDEIKGGIKYFINARNFSFVKKELEKSKICHNLKKNFEKLIKKSCYCLTARQPPHFSALREGEEVLKLFLSSSGSVFGRNFSKFSVNYFLIITNNKS